LQSQATKNNINTVLYVNCMQRPQ